MYADISFKTLHLGCEFVCVEFMKFVLHECGTRNIHGPEISSHLHVFVVVLG